LRLVLAIALIGRALGKLSGDPSTHVTVLAVLAICTGLFLLMGLWTPISAMLVAAIQVWKICWKLGDPWIYFLLGTIAVAVAMLGPGFWSVDARLYGWKRIDPPTRKS
jgi:CDP-diglyceride synthetase